MNRTTPQTKQTSVPTPAHVGSPATNPQYSFPSHEEVARRAYEIWQRHGCPKGTEFQDWLAAQTDLRYRH